MDIFSRDVLRKIMNGEDGWEEMLPEGIAEIIKEKNLFNKKELSKPEEIEKEIEKK